MAKDGLDSEVVLRGLELSVVVPTFNERDNVLTLIERLAGTLDGIGWEVIFVDDNSPDGTATLLRQAARRDRRVRVLQRIGRRGLSSACVEGMFTSAAPYIAVMDADLQHDEALLPRMLERLRQGDIDIVVGSRYVEGGSVGAWARHRVSFSRVATVLAQRVLRAALSDPMSGFFMLRRETIEGCVGRLSAIGFKILVDIFASSPRPLRFAELPFVFRTRHAGESKLDVGVAWDYVVLLIDKLVGRFIPARLIAFCLVGGVGVGVHFLVLGLMYLLGVAFVPATTAATLVAMTSNFFLNNTLTYRDRRLRGWRMLPGLLSFMLVCSVGALANVGVAGLMFDREHAGWVLSALAGILAGTVWNYALTSFYTWKRGA